MLFRSRNFVIGVGIITADFSFQNCSLITRIMEMFRFAHSEYLWGLLIIPVLTLFFIWSRYLGRRALRRFGNKQTIMELMPHASKNRPVLKFLLLMLALAFFIVGTARPQFGSKLKKVQREGVEIIIALDVSNSMMAGDIQPNRLERADRKSVV